MSLLLATDLSIKCPGACILEVETLKIVDWGAIPEHISKRDGNLYARAFDIIGALVEWAWEGREMDAIAMEGAPLRMSFGREETGAARQAFYQFVRSSRPHVAETLVIVNPTEAKRALTGKGNAKKDVMVFAAMAHVRATSALPVFESKTRPEREAMADALGVGIAATRILFQRKARASYVRGQGASP